MFRSWRALPGSANVKPAGSGEPINNSGSASSYKYNIYSGGGLTPLMGTGDVVADPKFVLASVDAAVANFRLQSTSPAINRGQTALAPYLDLDGSLRYGNPDSGAYEFVPSAPAALVLAAVSDTGTAGDNKTNLNNSSAATRLSFTVTGTLSGATVALYNGLTLLGSAVATGTSTTVQTNGTAPLADGPVVVTATQTFASAPSASTAATTVTVETVAPAPVGTLVVDDATGQRSRVRTARLTFSEASVLDASGLVVTNALGAPVPFTLAAAAGSTVFTLTFAGPSLDDGVYTVALAAGALRDTAGNPLAGGVTAAFHRLYGDVDGNGTVDIADFNAFAPAFGTAAGQSGYVGVLDYEGDGVIDIGDFNAFAPRFGTSVPVPAAVYAKAPAKTLAVRRV